MKASRYPWPPISDEALVERVIPAIQQAILEATLDGAIRSDDEMTALDGPNVANAILLVLATILEEAPESATPMGMRLVAEAASKELAQLMREARQLKLAAGAERGAIQ